MDLFGNTAAILNSIGSIAAVLWDTQRTTEIKMTTKKVHFAPWIMFVFVGIVVLFCFTFSLLF